MILVKKNLSTNYYLSRYYLSLEIALHENEAHRGIFYQKKIDQDSKPFLLSRKPLTAQAN